VDVESLYMLDDFVFVTHTERALLFSMCSLPNGHAAAFRMQCQR